MVTMTIALVLFGIAATGGLLLAYLRFTNRNLPLPLAFGHGALAASGIITLLLAVRPAGTPTPARVAAGMFVVGARRLHAALLPPAQEDAAARHRGRPRPRRGVGVRGAPPRREPGRLMRHPLHTAFVHFPLALLGTSLVFDVVGLLRDDPLWWSIAFWNIALGLAIGVLTATTGFIDSLKVPADSPASPLVTRHMVAVATALTCYGASIWARGGAGAPEGLVLAAALALEGLGLVLLLLGGYWGGEMVYRHGVGRVDASPDANESEHLQSRSSGV
jgi:uncharacterized membrane protein